MICENNNEALEGFEEVNIQIPLQKLFDEILVFVSETDF